MTHQLGSPLPGAPGPHSYHEMDHVEEMDDTRIPRNCPRIHPWCSVAGCTERPLRQFVASTSKQIMFMCKTHFTSVPTHTREGWKQYRGSRTFPETKIAVVCRPGPNRGNGGAAAAAAAAGEVDPGYTNHPEDEKSARGQTKNAMWPGKVYNVLYQVWNAHAEQKKLDTGDSYITSCHRADLVPEAARVLREQGQPDMANILDNTTEGARKVIHSRMLAKYLKNREAFSAKLRGMGLDAQEVADWDAALSAAQHHADLMPVRERDTHHPTLSHSHSHSQGDPMSAGQEGVAEGGGGGGGGGGGAGSSPGHEPGRSMYNGALLARKKMGRKNKMKLLGTPEAKRARALDSMVSAAERSNALQKGAAEAGAEHLRRLELADAERLSMEKDEHALRMAIGKSALALLNKMVGEAPLELEPPPPHGAGAMG